MTLPYTKLTGDAKLDRREIAHGFPNSQRSRFHEPPYASHLYILMERTTENNCTGLLSLVFSLPDIPSVLTHSLTAVLTITLNMSFCAIGTLILSSTFFFLSYSIVCLDNTFFLSLLYV